MPDTDWELLTVIVGDLQAELIRGLLEAQGIQSLLFQEGAGRSVYHVTVGPIANVEILVPASQIDRAREVLSIYHQGGFEEEDNIEDQ